jgi:hypothetical protein
MFYFQSIKKLYLEQDLFRIAKMLSDRKTKLRNCKLGRRVLG